MRVGIERTFRDLGDEQEEQRLILAAQMRRGDGLIWEEVLKSRRVLLVSEAGVGKTYECQQQAKRLWDAGEPAFYLDLAGLKDNLLRDLLDAEQEERFNQWLVSQSEVATFFLDSIDELELTLGKFDAALARFAKPLAGHLKRIRMVVTSRPIPIDEEVFRRRLPIPPSAEAAPSPHEFADIAVQRRPQKEEEAGPPDWRNVALLPLLDSQIREMAAHEGVTDVDAFMADIVRRDAQDFARRPQDLIELCANWHAKQQVRTHAEQVATNIAMKLKPRASSERPEKAELSEAKALDGARRLALASLLARNLTIRHSADADIAAQDNAALEPSEILKDWDVKERATLLERPLFGFATYGRVRFHHRSVIEYLAAEELYARLERGMPRASVHRLLFAETAQGKQVVRPSMQPVAAWLARRRDDIFEHIRDIEPTVLLDYGDPASLRPQQRIQALRAYATRYGMGGWRGLKVPYLQIHRFASPELGPEIQSLWAQGIENTEVKQLLLRLIAAAKIEPCADIAYSVVNDPTADVIERVFALDALIAVDDSRLSTICDVVETDRVLWPNKLARIALDRLFPLVMSPEQLCRALQTVTEHKRTVGELTYHLPIAIASANLAADRLDALRAGLDALIAPGTSWSDTAYSVVTERRDLVRMFTVACLQLWKSVDVPDSALMASTVRALRLIDRSDVGNEEYPKDLRDILQPLSSEVRAQVFWEDKRFFESFHRERDSWRMFHEVAFHGLLDLSIDKDWTWLCDAVGDVQRPKDERQLALETALWLNRFADSSERSERVATLKGLCGVEPELLAEIEKDCRAPDPKWIEKEARREAEKREREAKDAADHQSWVAFWEEVARNPDEAFADERAGNTVWNLWQAMSREGAESRATGWNRRFIESYFGKDIADRMRAGLMRQWRADRPTVRSERPENEKNRYFIRWQLGVAGIAAEAEDPEWANKLSDDEARLAARYAPVELNGFPSWFDSLAAAHPTAIDAIIGNELSAELDEPLVPNSHSGTLQDIGYAAPDTAALFVPRLLKWFRAKAGVWSENECASAAANRLSNVLKILLKHGDEEVRREICDRADVALQANPATELMGVWLPILLELDPVRGVAAFEQIITPLPVEVDGQAVGWFSSLFGRHGGALVNLKAEGFTPDLILRLLRLAYGQVRFTDDLEHEGVFSPGRRDDAQSARNNILDALLSLKGEAGWRAKIEMADDPLAGHFRDRLIAMANEASAEEADGSAFTYAQLAALDEFGEAPPDTRDAIFALMRDRLDDLDDLLRQDISPRETWAEIRVERLMRRAIAHELRNMGNGCYTVDQEAVTGDEKETDIRLRSTTSNQQATIELKVGEADWSAAVLRDKLRDQLVQQYMASDDCRAGCMLITVATDRGWDHPDTNARLNFAGLIDFLRTEAEKLVEEFGGTIRLLVKGMDLRPRLPQRFTKKKGLSEG